MIKLGLDFDNTLTNYDSLFFKLALEKKLVPKTLAKSKLAVRDFLRASKKEREFTLLQGEVYGKRIFEAKQSEGMFKALKKLKKDGINFYIVSHKSKNPYLGPKYDLHDSAMKWLERNNFFSADGLRMSKDNVYFELTKESKINRIEILGCTHYVDDLPEILMLLNNNIKKIHYNPTKNLSYEDKFENLYDWQNISQILNLI
tara:strand:- start:23 stop:628 length:606 start_codon:yes stop_codon:yes gene_type:complete